MGEGGRLAGDEIFAGDEDGLVAVIVVAGFIVQVHVPKEDLGGLKELVVKGVLRDGLGEVRPICEGGGVTFVECEFVEEGAVANPDGAVVGAEDDVAGLGGGGRTFYLVIVVLVGPPF